MVTSTLWRFYANLWIRAVEEKLTLYAYSETRGKELSNDVEYV